MERGAQRILRGPSFVRPRCRHRWGSAVRLEYCFKSANDGEGRNCAQVRTVSHSAIESQIEIESQIAMDITLSPRKGGVVLQNGRMRWSATAVVVS